MDHPELVPGPAGRDVEHLYHILPLADGQRPVRGRVDHGQEDDIALVPLKLRCIAAKETPLLVLGHREPPAEYRVDAQGLVGADHADDADRAVVVLRSLADRGHEGRDLQRFLFVDLVDRDPGRDVMGDQMRLDLSGRRLAQGADLAAVTELVAELDDVGHATEVFQQPNRSPE